LKRQPYVALATLSAAAGIALVAVAVVTSRLTNTWDEFGKVIGLWVAPIASFIAAGASFWVATQQIAAARDLEDLRLELSQRLEFSRGRIAAERKAYDELYAAATAYYYTLSLLEIGKHDQKRLQGADQTMVAASRYLVALPDEHSELWMFFWQAARAAVEAAAKSPTAASREELWAQRIGEISSALTAFQAIAKAKHIQASSEANWHVGNRTP
jgi:phosphate/sulfate permease